MKYIIASKDVFKGTSTNDVPDPCLVTEIATELVITRLHLLSLLSTGELSKEDTLVCIEDRKCLYENIFPNIISYQQYCSLTLQSSDTVFDLLEPGLFMSMAGGSIENRLIPYKPFYKNWERDKELITNVNFSQLENYDTTKPFVALVIRRRGAWGEKNMSDEFWQHLLDRLEESNTSVLIFGKESESFCNRKNTQHVSCYRDWCSVVRHENCKHVASTMTGGVYPLLIFGNPECKMTIIDNTRLMDIHGEDPSFYNSCINFQHIAINFINKIPTTDEFYQTITADL